MAALPNSNISTSLVANTLQTSSHNVGALCSHENINKWSKYKPLIWPYTNLSNLPVNMQRHQAADGKCGFKDIQWMDVQQILDHYLGEGLNCWEYARPTGGASAPYRLGDFRGYDHDAPMFLQSTIIKGDEIRINRAIGSATYTFNFNVYDTGTNITIDDFSNAHIGLDGNAKITALIYAGTNLPNTGSILPDSIQYGTTLNSDQVSITVDFREVTSSTSACNVVFCLSFVTQSENYLPIPYDDNHYYCMKVSLTNQVTDANVHFHQLGFAESNGTTVSPIADIRTYADPTYSGFRPFKVVERGVLTVDLQITSSDEIVDEYKLYRNNDLLVTIDYTDNLGQLQHSYLTNLLIRQINGTTPQFPHTFPAGSTQTVRLQTQGADVTFPAGMQDGVINLRLYDNRPDEDVQWALDSRNIYVDMSPYND